MPMEWPFFGTELHYGNEDLEPTFILRNTVTNAAVCLRCGRPHRPFLYLNEGDALVAVCPCCFHLHGIQKYLRDPSLLPSYTWALEAELCRLHEELAEAAVSRARVRQSQGARQVQRRPEPIPRVPNEPEEEVSAGSSEPEDSD